MSSIGFLSDVTKQVIDKRKSKQEVKILKRFQIKNFYLIFHLF